MSNMDTETMYSAPERVIVRDKGELYKKLEEAEEDVRCGRVYDADEVFKMLRDKHNL